MYVRALTETSCSVSCFYHLQRGCQQQLTPVERKSPLHHGGKPEFRTFFLIIIIVIITLMNEPNRLEKLTLLSFLVWAKIRKQCLVPTSSLLIRIPKSLDKVNLITGVKLETVTLPVKLRGSVSTALLLWIYSVSGRGSQHLANCRIQEVQKATLSRGTCNPFIQPYLFIFRILCVTCAVLVCFVPFSVSVQRSPPLFYYSNTVVWLGRTGERFWLMELWQATIAAVESVNTSPLNPILTSGCSSVRPVAADAKYLHRGHLAVCLEGHASTSSDRRVSAFQRRCQSQSLYIHKWLITVLALVPSGLW